MGVGTVDLLLLLLLLLSVGKAAGAGAGAEKSKPPLLLPNVKAAGAGAGMTYSPSRRRGEVALDWDTLKCPFFPTLTSGRERDITGLVLLTYECQ